MTTLVDDRLSFPQRFHLSYDRLGDAGGCRHGRSDPRLGRRHVRRGPGFGSQHEDRGTGAAGGSASRPRAGPDDPAESVQFADGRVFPAGNGQALVRQEAEIIYLAIPLRNVGAGLAMLRGYRLESELGSNVAHDPRGVALHLRGDPAPRRRRSPHSSGTY